MQRCVVLLVIPAFDFIESVAQRSNPVDIFLRRLDQLRVVSIEERIHSVVGSLDTGTMAEVDDALKLSLGLE